MWIVCEILLPCYRQTALVCYLRLLQMCLPFKKVIIDLFIYWSFCCGMALYGKEVVVWILFPSSTYK